MENHGVALQNRGNRYTEWRFWGDHQKCYILKNVLRNALWESAFLQSRKETCFWNTRKLEKVLPWVENTFYLLCGGKPFPFFGCLLFIFRLSAAPSEMNTSGKVCFRHSEPIGKVTFLKVLIFTFLPGIIVRHDPYRTLLPGQRHHGRPGASGWPTRRWRWRPPTAGWAENGHLVLENSHLPKAFSWKISGN